MKITSFKYFDTFFHNLTSDTFEDDDTFNAGNQRATTTLSIQLQIIVASNMILESKLAEAKTSIKAPSPLQQSSFLGILTHQIVSAKGLKAFPSKDKLKYLKGYKIFSDEAGQ